MAEISLASLSSSLTGWGWVFDEKWKKLDICIEILYMTWLRGDCCREPQDELFSPPLDIWLPITLMSLDVTQLRSAVKAAASVAQQALRDNAMEACLSDLEFLSVLQPTKQRHLLPKCHVSIPSQSRLSRLKWLNSSLITKLCFLMELIS